MPTRTAIVLVLTVLTLPTAQARAEAEAAPALQLVVTPSDIKLNGRADRQQVLVTGIAAGQNVDLTRKVAYHSDTPEIVEVGPTGVVVPRSDGTGTLRIDHEGARIRVSVRVTGTRTVVRTTYEHDVLPVLTRAGCNAGPCHGKARGQNGFQLSLLGFDPDFDVAAIAVESRGRRIFPAAPEHSLLLRKAIAEVPHGGGRKIDAESPFYEILRDWIAEGTPRAPADAPKLERISVSPAERLMAPLAEQQLVVTAHYSDGSSSDVTHLAAYQSNESAVVGVDPEGLVKAGAIPGSEAVISARFLGHFANCEITIPLPGEVAPELYERLPRSNFIDGLVWDKLKRLGITPSAPASDATFLRRAYLDVIGRIPTPEETRAFLADNDSDKRARLIDRLLERPEYADFWASKWVDLLRPNPYRVGIKAVYNLDAWIRDAFRRNMPYDEFARRVVTARGSTFRDGPATVFRDRREPEEVATMVSQLFLGIRLECAKCHHHPFESWGQEQFYSFAAYFSRIGRKGTGLSPPISGSEEMVYTAKSGSVKHPLTGEALPPKPLFGSAAPTDDPDTDPRDVLARWMTEDGKTYFARVMVNRVWADLMGRGIVEPVDDLRATNPPSNAPLLDALADDFRQNHYDLKRLIRTIMSSTAYALSSEPNERNLSDTRNFSRHYRQRLRAEVALDAIGDITGVPESFDSAPAGTRAVAVWTHRTPSLFLDTFGRPDPNQDPPCERTSDTSVVQALHLMNAPNLHSKATSDDGLPNRLVKANRSPREIVEELYLWTFSRFPTDEERQIGEELFAEPNARPRRAAEDLLWALLNTAEFLFKD